MSGRRTKALRRLAALYGAHLAQERDAEVRALWVRAWVEAAERRGEGRALRRALAKPCPAQGGT